MGLWTPRWVGPAQDHQDPRKGRLSTLVRIQEPSAAVIATTG